MEHLFARRMRQMRPSTIREILKVASQPDVISFAGGLPAPELFPMEEIRRACARVMAENGASALQYGASEGYCPLREYICAEMERRGIRCGLDQVLITTGSQQGLDLAGRFFWIEMTWS
ncbi:MAG: hypothetical protein ACUVRM_01700 [Bacillota bacterium]